VNRCRAAFRTTAAAGLGLLQAVCLLAAVTPPLVWCHKPGGDVRLEFELVAGECDCDQCALCREHERREHAATPDLGPVVLPSRCRHSRIEIEAGSSSVPVLDSERTVASPAQAARPSVAVFAAPAVRGGAEGPAVLYERDVGPPRAGILRC
jgi:hypothetical protein